MASPSMWSCLLIPNASAPVGFIPCILENLHVLPLNLKKKKKKKENLIVSLNRFLSVY